MMQSLYFHLTTQEWAINHGGLHGRSVNQRMHSLHDYLCTCLDLGVVGETRTVKYSTSLRSCHINIAFRVHKSVSMVNPIYFSSSSSLVSSTLERNADPMHSPPLFVGGNI